jgi:CheY-like chemotaxis protein
VLAVYKRRDVMMPRMGGYEAVEKIRKQYPRSPLPIIMISGSYRTRQHVAVPAGLHSANRVI